MTQTCRTPVRQPNTADQGADKWALLAALTKVARHYGLNHRSLSVLKALLTFYPGRPLPTDKAVVFPSNRTLSERLGGMPESTLRRHLTALVKAGVIQRHDSPNGKRYRRHGMAFGFDLAPLAQQEQHLTQRAIAAQQAEETLAQHRAELADLYRSAPDTLPLVLLEEVRLTLRRKVDLDVYQRLIQAMKDASATAKLSGDDSQNERHIKQKPKHKSSRSLTLAMIQNACRTWRTYCPDCLENPEGMLTAAHRMAPMLSIDPAVFQKAIERMGLEQAALTILCLVERAGEILDPSAYLSRLSQRAQDGQFDLVGMIEHLVQRNLSADNRKSACLSEA